MVWMILFTLATPILSQFKEIPLRQVATKDGLSNFTVLSITQDHQGFVWFGTRNGLNKFDGVEVKVYKHLDQDPTNLGSSYINALLTDPDSMLWVGTNEGLYRYDLQSDSFERIHLEFTDSSVDASGRILAIFRDKDLLWIGTESGIYYYDIVSSQAKEVVGSDGLSGRTFCRSGNGDLYIGTNRGIYVADDGQTIEHFFPDEQLFEEELIVNAIIVDYSNRLWVGLENDDIGLLVLQQQKKTHQILNRLSGGLPSNIVRSLYMRQNGEVWVGSRDGLVIIGESDLKSYRVIYNKNDKQSISQNSIRAIYPGFEGIIWIGTYSGGAKLFDPGTEIISHYTGGYDNEQLENNRIIASIFEDKENNLWVGTEGRGITLYDKNKSIIKVIQAGKSSNSIPHNKVKDFEQDWQGRLFIGTNDGLSIYNPKTDQFYNISTKPTPRGFLLSGTVHDLTLDDQGNIWVGTIGNHEIFQVYDISRDTIYHYASDDPRFPGHRGLIVNSQFFDKRRGVLWAGGDHGIAAFDTRNKVYLKDQKFRSIAEKLRETIIYDLFIDQEDRLWIATIGSGLYLLDITNYHFKELQHHTLAGESFYSLTADDDQNIWASSNSSLIKIYTKKGMEAPISKVERFGVQDGLPNQQYYRKAVLRGKDGTLYFGGYNGFISFDPKKLINVVRFPDVVIKNLTIDGESIPIKNLYNNGTSFSDAKGVTLASDQSSFSVNFVAPTFINPESIWYQYKLMPSDQGWQDIGNSNVINFSRLKPGNYQLQMRASSDRANFGPKYSSLQFTIEPPVWKTPVAYLIYGVLLLLLLYVFFTISRRWERLNQKLIFEHMAHEKEVLFNQQRAKFFTNISHELRTPLTLILAPLENMVASNFGNARMKNQLLLMLRNGERMLQLVNRLLDFRKLETGHMTIKVAEGDLVNFVKEVTLAFREQANLKDITFNVVAHEPKINVFFDRDKFEIILFNLLSNAMKYTPKDGEVRVELKWEEKVDSKGRQAVIEVINTGKGIPDDQLQHIFERFYTGGGSEENSLSSGVGLEIVKELVKMHHAVISVESEFDREGIRGYTKFKVFIRTGSGHFAEEEILKNYRSSEDVDQYKSGKLDPMIRTGDIKEQEERSKILIVDDNQGIRQLVASVFSQSHDVIEAVNGEEGLRLANEDMPDLIISDIMMPVMDGIELCKQVKSGMNTSHIPVILLTARTAVTFKYEGLETGADDYLIKPFNSYDLRLRAENVINQRKNLRRIYQKSSLLVPEDVTITSVDEKMLKRTVDFVLENMEKGGLTVQVIAEEVGMSRVNFYRKIKALTNLSAAEFLRKIRMERAAQLLKTNKLNISEVRYKVGFSDADYFRSCFKEEYGITPSEYQEKYGQVGDEASTMPD